MRARNDPHADRKRRRAKSRPTPYVRIMRAAKAGRGIRLTADEVAILSIDHSIYAAALNDEAGEWVS